MLWKTTKTRWIGGNVGTSSNPKKANYEEHWWFAKAILFASVLTVALFLLGYWIPLLHSHNVFVAAGMTGAVGWAVLTTFRQDWEKRGFWLISGVLFGAHLALMWFFVVFRETKVERTDALWITIPEVTSMIVILAAARTRNYFVSQADVRAAKPQKK
jgi:hypothetical protein